MAMLRTLLSLAVAAMLLNVAMAATYSVGGPGSGWDTTTNLQAWATSQSFSVGDNLAFQYMPSHNVVEVTKADYDSCQITNPIQTYTGGNTIIPLGSPGKRYFICGTIGHCSQGMKVEVDTLATTASPPATPATSSQAAAPLTPPPDSPITPVSSPPMSLLSPHKSPASSPTSSSVVPSTESQSGSAPPPPSSSATELKALVGSAVRFGFAMMMLLNL